MFKTFPMQKIKQLYKIIIFSASQNLTKRSFFVFMSLALLVLTAQHKALCLLAPDQQNLMPTKLDADSRPFKQMLPQASLQTSL